MTPLPTFQTWATSYLKARGFEVMPGPARRISSPFILEHVAIYFGVDMKALLDSRRGELPRIRQVGMFLACELTSESYAQIARTFRRQDHTTVMYGRDRIRDLIAQDQRLAGNVERLREILGDSFAAYAKLAVAS